MPEESSLIKQSYQLIRKDLGLEEEWVYEETENSFDRLEKFLTKQISYLLDHNFNRLLNALYRIDIAESDVKQILSGDDLANKLAKKVIEREKQKVLTRLKYRTS